MESERFVPFKCAIHGFPLDGTWQCPDRACRAAHCPLCGRYEKDRCEHLFCTVGEWVYYAPEGVSSEDFPSEAFEEFELDVLIEAFQGDSEMAQRLADGGDPLQTLLGMAEERMETPRLVTHAGGWSPGADSWSNTWVTDPAEALSKLFPLMQRYHQGLVWLAEESGPNDA